MKGVYLRRIKRFLSTHFGLGRRSSFELAHGVCAFHQVGRVLIVVFDDWHTLKIDRRRRVVRKEVLECFRIDRSTHRLLIVLTYIRPYGIEVSFDEVWNKAIT